jgi:hypothetical protein
MDIDLACMSYLGASMHGSLFSCLSKSRGYFTMTGRKLFCQDVLWQPPPYPCIVKIKWDAGLDKMNGRVGFEMIAVTVRGSNVLAARSTILQLVVEPIVTTKALAALYVSTIFSKEVSVRDGAKSSYGPGPIAKKKIW